MPSFLKLALCSAIFLIGLWPTSAQSAPWEKEFLTELKSNAHDKGYTVSSIKRNTVPDLWLSDEKTAIEVRLKDRKSKDSCTCWAMPRRWVGVRRQDKEYPLFFDFYFYPKLSFVSTGQDYKVIAHSKSKNCLMIAWEVQNPAVKYRRPIPRISDQEVLKTDLAYYDSLGPEIKARARKLVEQLCSDDSCRQEAIWSLRTIGLPDRDLFFRGAQGPDGKIRNRLIRSTTFFDEPDTVARLRDILRKDGYELAVGPVVGGIRFQKPCNRFAPLLKDIARAREHSEFNDVGEARMYLRCGAFENLDFVKEWIEKEIPRWMLVRSLNPMAPMRTWLIQREEGEPTEIKVGAETTDLSRMINLLTKHKDHHSQLVVQLCSHVSQSYESLRKHSGVDSLPVACKMYLGKERSKPGEASLLIVGPDKLKMGEELKLVVMVPPDNDIKLGLFGLRFGKLLIDGQKAGTLDEQHPMAWFGPLILYPNRPKVVLVKTGYLMDRKGPVACQYGIPRKDAETVRSNTITIQGYDK